MLCKFTINNTKISSHGLISKHKQFISNHLQNTFSHQENHVTIHVNSETLGLLFTATKFGIFFTRFKGFETEFTAKSSLRISLTTNMALSQRINQVGKISTSWSCWNSTKSVPTRSPHRVDRLYFLLRREPTVRLVENLERRGSSL